MPRGVASPKRKKAKPSTKRGGQVKLLGAGGWVQTFKREPTLVDQEVLMTDAIYEGKVPEEMKGMLFHYTVTNYDHAKNRFELTYRKKYISKEGITWISDDSSEREKLPKVTLESVDRGIKLFNIQYSKIKTYELEKEKVAKELLKEKEGEEDNELDFTDLDDAAASDPKGWRGESVIELEFELTGEERLVPCDGYCCLLSNFPSQILFTHCLGIPRVD